MTTKRPFTEESDSKRVSKRVYRQPKIIAFYSPKGGVGKSTNVVAIARTLAAQKLNVLVYDCDPQCTVSDLLAPDRADCKTKTTLYEQMNQFEATSADLVFVCDNLWLVPGDRRINNLDFSLAFEEITNTRDLVQKPRLAGKINWYIMATAQEYSIDFVLLDMSTSTGPLNRWLVTSSHYLVVPTTNDSLCCTAFNGLDKILAKWARQKARVEADMAAFKHPIPFPLTKHKVEFIGYITNRTCLFNNSQQEKMYAHCIDEAARKLMSKDPILGEVSTVRMVCPHVIESNNLESSLLKCEYEIICKRITERCNREGLYSAFIPLYAQRIGITDELNYAETLSRMKAIESVYLYVDWNNLSGADSAQSVVATMLKAKILKAKIAELLECIHNYIPLKIRSENM